jgi:hypothetical protein
MESIISKGAFFRAPSSVLPFLVFFNDLNQHLDGKLKRFANN